MSAAYREGVERAVIGLLMKSATMGLSTLDDVAKFGVTPEHFENLERRWMWEQMLSAWEGNRDYDFQSLMICAQEGDDIPLSARRAVEIIETYSRSPWAQNVAFWIRKLLALSAKTTFLGRVANSGGKLSDEHMDGPEDVVAAVDEMTSDIVRANPQKPSRTVPGVQAISRAIDEIEACMTGSNRKSLTIATGLGELDARTGGMSRGGFYLIGARPGVGKTTVALSILDHVTSDLNMRGLFFSQEMTETELATKLIAKRSGIDSAKLRSANMVSDDADRMMHGVRLLKTRNFGFNTSAMPSFTKVKSIVHAEARGDGIDLVVIDYVQQLQLGGRRWSGRVEELTAISNELKQLAMELEIVVVACAQLNRESEKGSEVRVPRLGDLRDCGALEADASGVWLMHAPSKLDRDAADEDCLVVAKNRSGWEGRLGLEIERHTGRVVTKSILDVLPTRKARGAF